LIRELHIENFKCFKKAQISLSNITIISGGNGVGKSSIIQSLLLLRQSADQLRVIDGLTDVAESGSVEFRIRLNSAYELALGNSLVVTNSEIESAEIRIGILSDEILEGRVLYETFVADTVNPSVNLTCKHTAENTLAMLMRNEGSPLFAREFHYLVAERNGPRELSGVSDKGFLSTGLAGEFTADAMDKAERERNSIHVGLQLVPDSSLFKVQLEAWMRLLVPGVRLATTRYVDINRVRMSVERVGVSTPSMSPTNTGFGISYVLPIVVSGLLAAPGTMLIVENPEAHLHPSAQSAIGTFLACVASTGVQVFVETHSENVINGVRLAVVNGHTSPDMVKMLFLNSQDGDTQPAVTDISIDGLGRVPINGVHAASGL
jgi:predicted ATPase